MWKQIRRIANDLEEDMEVRNSSPMWMNQFLRLACVDVFGAAGLGIDLAKADSEDRVTTKSYLKPFEVGDMVPVFLKLLQPVPKLMQNLSVIAVSKAVWGIDISRMRGLVEDRISSSNQRSGRVRKGVESFKQDHFLIDGLITKCNGRISSRSLLRHAMTTMAACTEMVSNELAWAIHALSRPKNQHVQDRLRQEIRTAFPLFPEDMTCEDVAKVPYLIGVVNEVLRLFPNVAHRYRKCQTDTTLDGIAIKKGSLLTWPVWAMNRAPEYWGQDATELRPERWFEDQDALPREQYAFMTFGQGVRKCPGEHYTRAVMACTLLALVGLFSFSMPEGGDVLADEGKKVAFGIVMRAKINAVVEVVPGW